MWWVLLRGKAELLWDPLEEILRSAPRFVQGAIFPCPLKLPQVPVRSVAPQPLGSCRSEMEEGHLPGEVNFPAAFGVPATKELALGLRGRRRALPGLQPGRGTRGHGTGQAGRQQVTSAWAVTWRQWPACVLGGQTQWSSSGELRVAALLATRAWPLVRRSSVTQGRTFCRGWVGTGGDAGETHTSTPFQPR